MQRMQDHPRLTGSRIPNMALMKVRVHKLPISNSHFNHIYLSGSINPVFLEGYRVQWRPRMRQDHANLISPG